MWMTRRQYRIYTAALAGVSLVTFAVSLVLLLWLSPLDCPLDQTFHQADGCARSTVQWVLHVIAAALIATCAVFFASHLYDNRTSEGDHENP